MMNGMTIKQFAKAEFFAAVAELREAQKNPMEDKGRFLRASIRVHAAKGGVPKSYWHFAK